MNTAKKIELPDLINMVENVSYTILPDSTITVCKITLKSGFKAIGYSVTVNEADFNEQTGQQVSYDNAIDTLWELEGYHRIAKQYASEQIDEANTHLWENSTLGADIEYAQLAPLAADVMLQEIVQDRKGYFDYCDKYAPSTDANSNYVLPELGVIEQYVKKSKMPDCIMNILKANKLTVRGRYKQTNLKAPHRDN